MGQDGHHFAVMTGPGRIWLQSMPVAILAGAIEPFMPDHGRGDDVAAGAAGGLLGNLLR
jgi:hypothetical protein